MVAGYGIAEAVVGAGGPGANPGPGAGPAVDPGAGAGARVVGDVDDDMLGARALQAGPCTICGAIKMIIECRNMPSREYVEQIM